MKGKNGAMYCRGWLLQLRQNIALPIGVGFGIRDAASAAAVAGVAEAVIIGSRIVQELEQGESGLQDRLVAFLSEVRNAVDAACA